MLTLSGLGNPGNSGRDRTRMEQRRTSFSYEDLLACARGELFGAGNAQLPLPPMLMFDRISEIAEAGGEYGKGVVRAVLDLKPDLWFFPCHFKGDPVMPGCLGLDALWQLLGFLPRLARFARQGARARPRRAQIVGPSRAHRPAGDLRHRHQARHALQARARHRRRVALGGRLDHLPGDGPQGRPVPPGSGAGAERRLTAGRGTRGS